MFRKTGQSTLSPQKIIWANCEIRTSMAWCKTAVAIFQTHWSYCSLALSRRYDLIPVIVIIIGFWDEGEIHDLNLVVKGCRGDAGRVKMDTVNGGVVSGECLYALLPETLQWRHNGCDSVSNLQPHDCLLNRLFGRRKHQNSASLAFV